LPAVGQEFKQSCTHPNYPSATATPIDSSCPVQGSGGDEATQNTAKNDFCASGPATPITIAEMADLQKQVEDNKNIPFGNKDKHPLTSDPGPAEDRAPLVKLREGNEVVLTGYVAMSRFESPETVNSGKAVPNKDAYHDIHTSIVAKPGNAQCTGVVVEMIPHHRPTSWNPEVVNAVKTAKLKVRITGQLMFDSSHSPCIDGQPVKTGPNSQDPARVSLWEIHPIYKFEVCQVGDCASGSGWVPLEQWKQ
jgi:hypothetical protein